MGAAGSALHLGYSYYSEGNVLAITDDRAGKGMSFPIYDTLDRLKMADGPWGRVEFSYDPVGNRMQDVLNAVPTNYHYDPLPNGRTNVLTSTTGGRNELFATDAIGQVQADGAGVYTYTPTGLLATANVGGLAVTHAYHGDDLRVVKVKEGVTHYYARAPSGQLLSEFEEAGGQYRWTVDYVYAGPRLLTAVRPSDASVLTAITEAGTGGGTVTSWPAGIDCGSACEATFAAGVYLTLQAEPGADSRFVGWSGTGACTEPSAQASRTILVLGPTACTATFNLVHKLTVERVGPGSIAATVESAPPGIVCIGEGCPMPTGTFDADTTVVLTASAPPAGFAFTGWTGSGCVSDPGASQAFVWMHTDHTCTASYDLVAAKQGPANGADWLPTTVSTTWGTVPNAGYWVCVDQTANSACDTIWWPNGQYTSKWFDGLAPGVYYWQARSQTAVMTDADGGLWWSFTVGPPLGTTFVKVAPASGTALGGATAVLSWNAAGAPSCEVCWDTTPDNQCTGTWQAVGTATTLTVSGLATGTCYWQVRAAGTTLADNGTWWSFTVPVHVNKVWPPNGSTVAGPNVWTTWTTIPDAGYWVCVDPYDNGVCDTMFWPNGQYATKLFEGLAPGTYYWQARADTPGGPVYGDGGVWWSFTVTSHEAAGPMVAGDDGLLVPLVAGLSVTGSGVPDHCVSDRTMVWCSVRAELEAGHYQVKVRGVPGLTIWVDGELLLSALDVARESKTTADVDLEDGAHVFQWQCDACSLTTTVTPDPSWKRNGPVRGPRPHRHTPHVPRTPGGSLMTMMLVEGSAVVVEHYHLDALGSARRRCGPGHPQLWRGLAVAPRIVPERRRVRVVTDATGAVLRYHDYLPFGEEWPAQTTHPDQRLFTGKERDFETSLDYFGARYYRADIGRFTIVDPQTNVTAALVDPQRWNVYAYGAGNPVRYAGPDGRDISDLLNGFFGAIGADFGVRPVEAPSNLTELAGQAAGHLGAIILGTAGATTGGAATLGEAVAVPETGGASAVAIPATAAVAVQGAVVAVRGAAGFGTSLAKAANDLLGSGGPQITSKTLYNGNGVRVDVENPAPGKRPGEVHIQTADGKYRYDP